MRLQYRQVRIPGGCDPLAVGSALAASGAFDDYLIYERAGVVRIAADPIGRVSLRRGGLVWAWADTVRERPVGDRPIRQIAATLSAVPLPEWRMYGYAAFELAYLASGRPDLVDAEQLLFEAIVPGTELLANARGMVVRCLDGTRLPEMVERVRACASQRPPSVAPPHPVAVDSDATARVGYERTVALVLAEIRRGGLDKVILSRAVPCPFDVDLPATYLLARQHNTPVRSFLLRLGAVRALGLSPEIVVQVAADRTVTSEPLAGTRAFGLGAATDARLREELLADAKEVYEHAVSVRTALNELRAVCVPDRITLDDFLTVKERGTVQHLASTLRGPLLPGRSCWDAFAELFPAVTTAGIPKPRCYETIHRLETTPRGLYSGAVLTADSAGTLDAALVLRALIDQGDGPQLRAGAGVVAMSSPTREYFETCEKLRCVADHVVPRGVEDPPVAPANQPSRNRRIGTVRELA
jgi:salicylate synthase